MNSSQFWDLFEAYKQVHTRTQSESYEQDEKLEEIDEVYGLGGEVHPTTGQYTGQGRKPRSRLYPSMRSTATGWGSAARAVQGMGGAGGGGPAAAPPPGGAYNRSSSTPNYIDGGRKGKTGKGTLGAVGSAGMSRTPMDKAIIKRAELEKTGQFKRANRITRGIDSMYKPIQQYNKGKGVGKAEGRAQMRDSVDYDLYDLVLEYLLDEGLCESVENAEIMMAHMSESWVNAIVEEYKEIEEDADTVAHYNQLIKTTKDPKERKKFMTILTKIKQRPNNQMR